ncbi:MAG: DUF2442 domain-containing protein [Candidatus Hydrogenedentes bacterium]|nr:DUF2442 domain-containing protein [Candidatus Hydrogenedentota bacterium]
MPRVSKVEVLDGYRIDLTFDDGTRGVVDLADLAGKGVFSAWRDRENFEQVGIGTSGELVWGKDVDLCPDSLYLKVTGKQPAEVFPLLDHDHAGA